MPNSRAWKMQINILADNFQAIKDAALAITTAVNAAATYKDLPSTGSGDTYLYSADYDSPIEERITQLRAEADALEKQLARPKKGAAQ